MIRSQPSGCYLILFLPVVPFVGVAFYVWRKRNTGQHMGYRTADGVLAGQDLS